jgi:signal transduction histidine kinase
MKVTMSPTSHLTSDHESFMCTVAHDLRSPLMSVKGLIRLMQLESDKEHLKSYFELLEKSVDRMNHAIDDIITHSKNGTDEIEIELIDMKEIGEESINSLQFMTGAECVQISLSVEDGGVLFSSRKRLISIFSNIISNAIRYRDPEKYSFLNINVTFNTNGCQIVFEDNGIGIDEDNQVKVFEKFFLVSGDKGGTGIGLSTVKESVERLGGSIQLRSEIGIGTTFIIQLPNLIAHNQASIK